MNIVVLGASGATGKQVVQQLITLGHCVKVMLRPTAVIPDGWHTNNMITIIKATIHDMSADEMAHHLKDCNVVVCCLGHTLNLKGIYGEPRKLVTNAVRLVCDAYAKNNASKPLKFVLMNTAGNSNRDLKEPISTGQKMMIAVIRLLLPPHRDNESAADYLRLSIGQNHPKIQWVVVRPDTLLNEDHVTDYSVHPSPTRSAIFNPGKTSRINVGHFMASLSVDEDVWNEWKGEMPVIYNRETNMRKGPPQTEQPKNKVDIRP